MFSPGKGNSFTLKYGTLLLAIMLWWPQWLFAEVWPAQISVESNTSLTLTVQDRVWTIQLSQAIDENSNIPQHVQGTVLGDDKSWAAITIHHWPDDITGNISAFNDWLQIETFNSATRLLGTAPATDTTLVAIRPNINLLFQLGHSSIDRELPLTHPQTKHRATTRPRTTQIPKTTTRALRIGIVVDSLFNDHHGGRGMARAKAIVNSVDALLQKELGLAVEVVAIRDYTNPETDPFRTLTADVESVLMPTLVDIRKADPLLDNDLSLVHLFSGHLHQGVEPVAGLSWQNSVCHKGGYDVSLSTPFLFDTLLAAHEIAHNLGAPHDNSDQCDALTQQDDSYLMWPKISHTTRDSFSSCSFNYIQHAAQATCNVDVIDFAVNTSSVNLADANTHQLTINVRNLDANRSAANVFSHTTFSSNITVPALPAHCGLEAGTVICHHSQLEPEQLSQTVLQLYTTDTAQRRVRTELVLDRLVDVQRSNNVAQLVLSDSKLPSVSVNTVTVSSNTPASSNNAAATGPIVITNPIARTGSASVYLILLLLALIHSRLMVSINRVPRQTY